MSSVNPNMHTPTSVGGPKRMETAKVLGYIAVTGAVTFAIIEGAQLSKFVNKPGNVKEDLHHDPPLDWYLY